MLPTGGAAAKKTGKDDEFRPFIRRLPEFKFWLSLMKAILVSLFLTTTRLFDIPVYWPILLGYFIILFIITMRKQIRHMYKHRYIPFTTGKKKYEPAAKQPYQQPQQNGGQAYYNSGVGMSSAFSAPKPLTTLTNVHNPQQSTLTMHTPSSFNQYNQ